MNGGGQGECERGIEDFVKFKIKNSGEGGWSGPGVGGQGGCERKFEELKFLQKCKKKKNRGGGCLW